MQQRVSLPTEGPEPTDSAVRGSIGQLFSQRPDPGESHAAGSGDEVVDDRIDVPLPSFIELRRIELSHGGVEVITVDDMKEVGSASPNLPVGDADLEQHSRRWRVGEEARVTVGVRGYESADLGRENERTPRRSSESSADSTLRRAVPVLRRSIDVGDAVVQRTSYNALGLILVDMSEQPAEGSGTQRQCSDRHAASNHVAHERDRTRSRFADITRLTGFDVVDVRFPTSTMLDGSDAMNADPDYSAAYVTLRTEDGVEGASLAFTIGRGNDVQVAAIQALAPALVGLDLAEVTGDLGGLARRLVRDSQFRWLGPEKGIAHMAVGAVVNAAWDLAARLAGKPVWRFLADMTSAEIVDLIDFRHISDALSPTEALE